MAITIALLAVFTAAELHNLERAWSDLQADPLSAHSLAELEKAAMRFGIAVRQNIGYHEIKTSADKARAEKL